MKLNIHNKTNKYLMALSVKTSPDYIVNWLFMALSCISDSCSIAKKRFTLDIVKMVPCVPPSYISLFIIYTKRLIKGVTSFDKGTSDKPEEFCQKAIRLVKWRYTLFVLSRSNHSGSNGMEGVEDGLNYHGLWQRSSSSVFLHFRVIKEHPWLWHILTQFSISIFRGYWACSAP